MRHPRSRTVRTAIVSLGILTLWAMVPPAAPAGIAPVVPAGYDLLETSCESTHFDFSSNPIPADFFAPGSEPFAGFVKFAGVPLETFNGHPSGDADTVVQRLQQMDFSGGPATIPIELVQLDLVSCEPITVTYPAGPSERWDVHVDLSPTAAPQGSMTVTPVPLTGGGTFDATLPVRPRFTFTRLSDDRTTELDGLPSFPLQMNGVPWAGGCVYPALDVPGINDGFCPGLTQTGQKQLTVASVPGTVDHGFYPAQPMLEHFKCYKPKAASFNQRQVQLTDQFGTRTADITGRNELCNPVRKRQEPFRNKLAHLTCYATTSSDLNREVVVRNQFGSQRLMVHKARRLCVPSDKRELQDPWKARTTEIDHFQCYGVTAVTGLLRYGPIGKVRLEDQFGVQTVRIGDPLQLCAPVQKNTTPSLHVVKHLVCYAIGGQPLDRRVQVRNQFEKTRLTVRDPVSLCVPTDKVVVP